MTGQLWMAGWQQNQRDAQSTSRRKLAGKIKASGGAPLSVGLQRRHGAMAFSSAAAAAGEREMLPQTRMRIAAQLDKLLMQAVCHQMGTWQNLMLKT